jgi:hypothetical protein
MSTVWYVTGLDPGASSDAGPTQGGESEPGQVCIPNISPHERRKRLAAGAIQLVVGLAILTVLVATGAARWWRLPLLLLFWGAASGFFQWRDKT